MGVVDSFSSDERAKFGVAPVSDAAPAGADVRATPEFEAIEAEVRKLDTQGPNAVDWPMVTEGSLDIIATKSKDFLVGAWCAYGLFRGEGLAGLWVGLSILHGIIVTHWEGAFPPVRRERARVAALDWLFGRLAQMVEGLKVGEAPAPLVVAVDAALRDIDTAMSERLQKETLSIGDIFRALRPHVEEIKRSEADAKRLEVENKRKAEAEAKARVAEEQARAAAKEREEAEARAAAAEKQREEAELRARAEAEAAAAKAAAEAEAAARKAAAEAQAAAPPQPPPPTQPAFAPQTATGSARSDVPAPALDELAPALRAQAQALLRQDPRDPRAFVLGRLASWLRVNDVPAGQNGKTSQAAPLTDLHAITQARQEKRLEAALASAEELVWSAPFCLDAHRHSYEVLSEFGPGFATAQAAVIGMLGYFVQRYAGCLDLAFADGRPFADAATKALIGLVAIGSKAHPRDAMEEAVGQANALVENGKAFDALDILSQTLRRASTGRERAYWQLAQARFCVENGFAVAALPLVEHLEQTVNERSIESWEPDLAAAVAELRLRVLMHPDCQPLFAEERRRVALEESRNRLARLDIAAAARLLRP